jgi:hypothetical protein
VQNSVLHPRKTWTRAGWACFIAPMPCWGIQCRPSLKVHLRASSHAERQEDELEVSLAVFNYSFGLGRTGVLAACEQSTGRKGSVCVDVEKCCEDCSSSRFCSFAWSAVSLLCSLYIALRH